jgi:hypothetical protein
MKLLLQQTLFGCIIMMIIIVDLVLLSIWSKNNLTKHKIKYFTICTSTSFRKTNFHPLRCALTAISISSTVVLSIHPPDSSSAFLRHTPAVPLNPKKLIKMPLTCCSTSKWKHKFMFCNLVRRFSSLFTNDHLACTNPTSSFPFKIKLKF